MIRNFNKLLFLITFFCVYHGLADTKDSSLSPGDQAPRFMLPALDGVKISIRDYCGDTLRNPWKNKKKHFVILNFWATYCIPCKKEIPELEKVLKKYESETKSFLISIDKEGEKIVKPYIMEAKYKSPVLIDKYLIVAKKYGVESVPALFLIDKDGKLIFKISGYHDDGVARIDSTLSELIVLNE